MIFMPKPNQLDDSFYWLATLGKILNIGIPYEFPSPTKDNPLAWDLNKLHL